MKVINFLLILLINYSCTGGGYDSGIDWDLYEKELKEYISLTDSFVDSINDSGELIFKMTKRYSDQGRDFIVIYNKTHQTYEAIDVSTFDPNTDNAIDYYHNNIDRHFINLIYLPGYYEAQENYEIIGYDDNNVAIMGWVVESVWVEDRYMDRASAIVFEKTTNTPKDLAKIAALKEVIQQDIMAKKYSENLGLSLNRSKDIAKLHTYWKKASKKAMTRFEVDSFTTELLGFNLNDGIKAYKTAIEGNSNSLDHLIKKTAETNDITPEHAERILQNLIK